MTPYRGHILYHHKTITSYLLLGPYKKTDGCNMVVYFSSHYCDCIDIILSRRKHFFFPSTGIIPSHRQFSIHLCSLPAPSSCMYFLMVSTSFLTVFFYPLILVFPRVFSQPDPVPTPPLVEDSNFSLHVLPGAVFLSLTVSTTFFSLYVSCNSLFFLCLHFSVNYHLLLAQTSSVVYFSF